jgi:hypothetical protein
LLYFYHARQANSTAEGPNALSVAPSYTVFQAAMTLVGKITNELGRRFQECGWLRAARAA